VPLKELPCGGCSKCLKAHNTWAKFVEEVDDVIPLAHLDSQPVIQQLTQESDIADGRIQLQGLHVNSKLIQTFTSQLSGWKRG
jgi:hypothetical protein